ncbi:MAG: hypothetical protein BJ554DRAFT_2239, partial [Olpidium bornovanus]
MIIVYSGNHARHAPAAEFERGRLAPYRETVPPSPPALLSPAVLRSRFPPRASEPGRRFSPCRRRVWRGSWTSSGGAAWGAWWSRPTTAWSRSGRCTPTCTSSTSERLMPPGWRPEAIRTAFSLVSVWVAVVVSPEPRRLAGAARTPRHTETASARPPRVGVLFFFSASPHARHLGRPLLCKRRPREGRRNGRWQLSPGVCVGNTRKSRLLCRGLHGRDRR